jgi:methylated-DNA-[protein]-cysteine S-methyltransferase
MKLDAKTPTVYDAVIDAPFGFIGVYAHGIQLDIMFLQYPAEVASTPSKSAIQAVEQIKAYLINPNKDFNLPLMLKGTAFQKRVWQAIATIPLGETRTYADIARQVGSGPRAVANACGANHLPLIIPCHRVVAKDGLGGFMAGKEGGLHIKTWLLQHEGVLPRTNANT